MTEEERRLIWKISKKPKKYFIEDDEIDIEDVKT